MKRIILTALCLALCLPLCACTVQETVEERDKTAVLVDPAPEGRLLVNVRLDGIEFGTVGDVNLFAPDGDITVFVRTTDSTYAGKTARFSFDGGDARSFTLLEGEHLYTTVYSASENGVYPVDLTVTDLRSSPLFLVGVMPPVERASDEFFYGVQAYFNRLYEWIPDSLIEGCDQKTTVDIYLKTMGYMGINAVRDDNATWGVLQKGPDKKINFKEQDEIVDLITGNGMYYNIIFGYNGGKWTVREDLRDRFDGDPFSFAFCPDPELWDTHVRDYAERYASNDHILWEIWNEPNWEFFVGEKEDYFDLLRRTATILKAADPDAFVYSGGLAVADREENLPYYEEAKKLIGERLLDGYGYHIHEPIDQYYGAMDRIVSLAERAGLTDCTAMNSESGIYGANPETIACKALYTRSLGGRGFMAYGLSSSKCWAEDVNKYAMFDSALCPKRAAIAYATVIRFLGNAHFEANEQDTDGAVVDRYTRDGQTVYALYAKTDKGSPVTLPEGDFTAYDMYGNVIEADRTVTPTKKPVYIVYQP